MDRTALQNRLHQVYEAQRTGSDGGMAAAVDHRQTPPRLPLPSVGRAIDPERGLWHVNIALVSEFATLAREPGADRSEVVRAASTKPFGCLPFDRGLGVSSRCLAIDPTSLPWDVNQGTARSLHFVDLGNEFKEYIKDQRVQRITQRLNRRLGSLWLEDPVADPVPLEELLRHHMISGDPHRPSFRGTRGSGLGHRQVCARRASAQDIAHAVDLLTDHDNVHYRQVERDARWPPHRCNREPGPNLEFL